MRQKPNGRGHACWRSTPAYSGSGADAVRKSAVLAITHHPAVEEQAKRLGLDPQIGQHIYDYVNYEGKRYDMGNKFGILQANIEVGLKHPDTRDELKAYLKELAENF